MNEETPSNSVICAKLEAVAETMVAHFNANKEDHSRFLDLISQHNGRLTKVERTWNMLVGAVLFSTVIIVPIILNLINRFISPK